MTDDGTRRAHARHFTRRWPKKPNSRSSEADQVPWLARVRADNPNFRAAFEWSITNGETELAARLAGALSWFWTLDGMLAEAVEYLERVAPLTTACRRWCAAKCSPASRSSPRRWAGWIRRGRPRSKASRSDRDGKQHVRACVRAECARPSWTGPSATSRRPRLPTTRHSLGSGAPTIHGCSACAWHCGREPRSDSGDPAGQRMAEDGPAGRASVGRPARDRACPAPTRAASPRRGQASRQQSMLPANAFACKRRSLIPKAPLPPSMSLARSVEAAGDTDRARRSQPACARARRSNRSRRLRCARRSKALGQRSPRRPETYASALRLIETADFERRAHELPLHARDRENSTKSPQDARRRSWSWHRRRTSRSTKARRLTSSRACCSDDEHRSAPCRGRHRRRTRARL